MSDYIWESVCVYLREGVCLCIVCLCGPACVPASLCVCVSLWLMAQMYQSLCLWAGQGLSWHPRKGPLLLDFWLVSDSSGRIWVWEPGRRVD